MRSSCSGQPQRLRQPFPTVSHPLRYPAQMVLSTSLAKMMYTKTVTKAYRIPARHADHAMSPSQRTGCRYPPQSLLRCRLTSNASGVNFILTFLGAIECFPHTIITEEGHFFLTCQGTLQFPCEVARAAAKSGAVCPSERSEESDTACRDPSHHRGIRQLRAPVSSFACLSGLGNSRAKWPDKPGACGERHALSLRARFSVKQSPRSMDEAGRTTVPCRRGSRYSYGLLNNFWRNHW